MAGPPGMYTQTKILRGRRDSKAGALIGCGFGQIIFGKIGLDFVSLCGV
jgi:hypothetical protein